MPRVVLNGQPVDLPEAPTLADALETAGVHLPTLCHDDRLAPSGNCRLCLVRIRGFGRPVPACATSIAEGMEIDTSSPDLEAARRGILEMLAARYPAEAVSSDAGKPFHQALAAYGIGTEPFLSGATDPALVDRSHPYITVDMNRCIQCARCVRICADVQGQFVWHVRERGRDVRIEPDGVDLLASSCVSCGACVDTCPTGALEDAAVETLGVPDAWTRTVCPYCGTGCELSVGTRDGRIVSSKPVRHSAVSKGHLCVKGRYAFEYVDAGDRLTTPMIREGDAWRPVSWDEALAFVVTRLRDVVGRHGPDAVGVLGSARQTNEESYLAQKFARIVIGTNNVDCCARVCHTPSSTALKRSLGAGLSTNSFDDIEQAGLVLICGANPTENHPIVGARIKQAVRRQSARLVVIDPRRIELADYADVFLRVHPGTNIPLLNAMAHVIVRERLVDAAFVGQRVEDYEAFAAFVANWPPERVADLCGVEADQIRAAARLYATVRPAMIVNGLGATEHVQGTDGVTALINLALLTGNFGKPGAGVNALRGQNNVQGAAHMGCEPKTLPGGISIEDGRHAFETLWHASIPRTHGLHQLEMLSAARSGDLKALWAIGYDVLLSNPNARETARALGAMDLVIVQDLFMTETARRFGSVVLPACSSFEKDGTFMNAERRIQRVRQAVPAAGASKSDWEIICAIAKAFDHPQGFSFTSAEEIWNEVRQGCAGARGMDYARLDSEGLQWPCPDHAHPGTPILHVDRWGTAERAPLIRCEWEPTPERTTPKYPLVLNTGRTLYAFNAGTMTGRCRTQELRPSDLVDISPEDASAAGLHEGDRVRLVSRYGSATLPVHVSPAIRAGELFATFHTTAALLNNVTGPHVDRITGTPEYKVTAVRMEKV
ncbi:MAG: formate dehydrogenase subunit alpha [Acidobacteria bacterium]|nr:MAG: formate dehydrogenase subunit alpha [Acidobacteriota bacterium]